MHRNLCLLRVDFVAKWGLKACRPGRGSFEAEVRPSICTNPMRSGTSDLIGSLTLQTDAAPTQHGRRRWLAGTSHKIG